jgi:hypothetical protein
MRLRKFLRGVATRALPLAAGTRVVRLRLPRRVRRVIGRPPRRFRAQVVVTATDAAGNRSVVRRTIRVRR